LVRIDGIAHYSEKLGLSRLTFLSREWPSRELNKLLKRVISSKNLFALESRTPCRREPASNRARDSLR
jgi:hypothetical protein